MTAEVLKDGGDFIVEQITKICQLVYEQRIAPTQWTSSMITPLPKKGNLELMANYKGIIIIIIELFRHGNKSLSVSFVICVFDDFIGSGMPIHVFVQVEIFGDLIQIGFSSSTRPI